jgi:hypothetical protein
MDNAGKIEMREPQSLGDVVWHASEEDGLPDVGYHIGLGGDASLWIGEISDTEWNEMAETEQALGSPGGWWIILHAGKERRVLGRAPSWPESSDAIEMFAGVLRAALTRAAARGRAEGMREAAEIATGVDQEDPTVAGHAALFKTISRILARAGTLNAAEKGEA